MPSKTHEKRTGWGIQSIRQVKNNDCIKNMEYKMQPEKEKKT